MATPKLDAYLLSLREQIDRPTPEAIALHIGNTPALLEERLRDAATMLIAKYRRLFSDALFVFAEKRLYAYDEENHFLEYRLRDNPNLPISYVNQQSNLGMVVVCRRIAAYSHHSGLPLSKTNK